MHHRLARAQHFSIGLVLALCTPAEARTPAEFAAALARYDAAPSDALEKEVDAAAAQRYATVSRLYWYTDLAEAQAAAKAQHKPILALRMLGRLDEELSCANSRFFRAALYSNAEVSRAMRERFVLYWSSERPVPVVTIDFGDGRKLVRTTTGNSAHYILDEDGKVVDVLPGLYAPKVFRDQLLDAARFAATLRGKPEAEKISAVIDRGERANRAAQERWTAVQRSEIIDALARAQRATVSKAVVEVPDLRRTAMVSPSALSDPENARWTAVGKRAFDLTKVLDPAGRALVARIFNAGPITSNPIDTQAMLARFEEHVVADTALNEFRVRPQIRSLVIRERTRDFARINAAVYAEAFATPRDDAWLGLLPRTEFTGLPGDGVALP